MTRDEFENNITYLSELIDFCYEVDCDVLDNIESDLGEAIEEDLQGAIRYLSWYTVRDRLNDINADYLGYFTRGDDWLTYYDAEDEFDYYKEQVLDWCLDNDVFDDAGEDEEEDDTYTYGRGGMGPRIGYPATEPEPAEDLSTDGFFDMIDSGIVDVSALVEKSRREAAEAEAAHARAIREAEEAARIAQAAANAADAETMNAILSDLIF